MNKITTKLLLLAIFSFSNAESITINFKGEITEINKLTEQTEAKNNIMNTIFYEDFIGQTGSFFLFKNEASRKILSKVLQNHGFKLENFSEEQFDKYKKDSDFKNYLWDDIKSNYDFYYDFNKPKPAKQISFKRFYEIFVSLYFENRDSYGNSNISLNENQIKVTHQILHNPYYEESPDMFFAAIKGETYLVALHNLGNILISLDSNSDINVEFSAPVMQFKNADGTEQTLTNRF